MEIIKKIKVLEVGEDYLYGVKGYTLYKYCFDTKRWKYEAKVVDPKYSFLSKYLLLKRFFRAEITNLYSLTDGTQICIGKKGIFRREKGQSKFEKCFNVLRGSRPLNLCVDEIGNIFFGEYFQNANRDEVFVYFSSDGGRTWSVKYKFSPGQIRHIHAVQHDPFTNEIWVVTGDDDGECLIGNTSDKFNTFEVKFIGGQEFRVCKLFFYKDYIAFATDSPFIENEINVFDRESLKVKTLKKVQGSVIKGGQCGEMSFLSTTVEQSIVNTCKASHLWISKNGLDWYDIYSDEKDFLPFIFQFGSIEFPNYIIKSTNRIYFSGRALKKTGNNSAYIEI